MKEILESNKSYRQKHWSELTEEERVIRLREVVRGLMREVGSLGKMVDELQKHEHNSKGDITIPLPVRYASEQSSSGVKDDEVYF